MAVSPGTSALEIVVRAAALSESALALRGRADSSHVGRRLGPAVGQGADGGPRRLVRRGRGGGGLG